MRLKNQYGTTFDTRSKVNLTTWYFPQLDTMLVNETIQQKHLTKILRAIADTVEHVVRTETFMWLTVHERSERDPTPVIKADIPLGEDDSSGMTATISLKDLFDDVLEYRFDDPPFLEALINLLDSYNEKFKVALAAELKLKVEHEQE